MECDIKFNDLKICFENGCQSNTKSGNSIDNFDKVSSAESFPDEKQVSLLEMAELEIPIEENNINATIREDILKTEDEISADFVNFINSADSNAEPIDRVSDKELVQISQMLLKYMPEMKTEYAKYLSNTDINRFPTTRNYFVTPEDLLVYTENMTKVGYINGRN